MPPGHAVGLSFPGGQGGRARPRPRARSPAVPVCASADRGRASQLFRWDGCWGSEACARWLFQSRQPPMPVGTLPGGLKARVSSRGLEGPCTVSVACGGGLGGVWAQTAAVVRDQVKTQKKLPEPEEAPHGYMQGVKRPEMNPHGTPAGFQQGRQDRSTVNETSFQRAALGHPDSHVQNEGSCPPHATYTDDLRWISVLVLTG